MKKSRSILLALFTTILLTFLLVSTVYAGYSVDIVGGKNNSNSGKTGNWEIVNTDNLSAGVVGYRFSVYEANGGNPIKIGNSIDVWNGSVPTQSTYTKKYNHNLPIKWSQSSTENYGDSYALLDYDYQTQLYKYGCGGVTVTNAGAYMLTTGTGKMSHLEILNNNPNASSLQNFKSVSSYDYLYSEFNDTSLFSADVEGVKSFVKNGDNQKDILKACTGSKYPSDTDTTYIVPEPIFKYMNMDRNNKNITTEDDYINSTLYMTVAEGAQLLKYKPSTELTEIGNIGRWLKGFHAQYRHSEKNVAGFPTSFNDNNIVYGQFAGPNATYNHTQKKVFNTSQDVLNYATGMGIYSMWEDESETPTTTNTFQIDYNLNGGSWDCSSVDWGNSDTLGYHPYKRLSTTDDHYDYTIPAENPTRDGYKFMGWKVTGGTLYYHYDSNNPNSAWVASDTENTHLRFFADSGHILELRTTYVSFEAQWEPQEKVIVLTTLYDDKAQSQNLECEHLKIMIQLISKYDNNEYLKSYLKYLSNKKGQEIQQKIYKYILQGVDS